ncbi:MAG: hypothetical protein KGJ86_00775 [Chloroflexota bacterium]|nr:hypothetical protein [Chloroflexota bacterium]
MEASGFEVTLDLTLNRAPRAVTDILKDAERRDYSQLEILDGVTYVRRLTELRAMDPAKRTPNESASF